MTIAIWCAGLLGLLVFGLGFAVSATRGSTGVNIGAASDPTDRLHKLVRAHANAAEYAPMLAILTVVAGFKGAPAWLLWTGVAAVFFRYVHAVGMILAPSLEAVYPPRFIGALGTYITGVLLAAGVLLV